MSTVSVLPRQFTPTATLPGNYISYNVTLSQIIYTLFVLNQSIRKLTIFKRNKQCAQVAIYLNHL